MVVRSIVSKIMRVGRTTVFLVRLAMIRALVFGVASARLGASGNLFTYSHNHGLNQGY